MQSAVTQWVGSQRLYVQEMMSPWAVQAVSQLLGAAKGPTPPLPPAQQMELIVCLRILAAVLQPDR